MKEQARHWWKQATHMVQEAADHPAVYAQWVEQLASRDPAIAVPALWALQQAGAAVIPTLVQGLRHAHPRVRRGCVDAIDHGGYGADARCVKALLPLLYDPVPHIRRAVWHTLFCERCQDEAKCEVTTPRHLDRVELLVQIGLRDPNRRLKQQLIGNLGNHVADPRAWHALEHIVATEREPALVAAAQEALANGLHGTNRSAPM